MNVTDFLIVFLLILAGLDGWRSGFLALLIDLVAFLAGLALAYILSVPVGALLGSWMALSSGLQTLLGFAVVFLAATLAVRLSALRFRPRLIATGSLATTANRATGALLNLGKQALALMIALNLLVILPVIPSVRKEIQHSRLAPVFIVERVAIGRAASRVIETAVYDLQGSITTKTISKEYSTIESPIIDLTVDKEAEQAMLSLANDERTSRGLPALNWNEALANVARLHSRDMWRRQYFSHLNPDGADPFVRLHQAGIFYLVAGENLALAPTTAIAHQGLMDSTEHKENILSPDYGQIGIGVVRNGLYGATYTQKFMN